MIMFHLLYFVESNKEYQKLINFSHIERDIYGITYLIFYEEVRCKNGRVFQVHNDLLIAVSFITHLLDLKKLKETMVKAGLNIDSLVNIFDLEFDLDERDKEKAKQIITEKNLITFLNKVDFRFQDDSILTLPESVVARNKLWETVSTRHKLKITGEMRKNKYIIEIINHNEKETYNFPSEEKRRNFLEDIGYHQKKGLITKDLDFNTYEIEEGKVEINSSKEIFTSIGDPIAKYLTVCMECGSVKYIKFGEEKEMEDEESGTIWICIICGSNNFMMHEIHEDPKHAKHSYQSWCSECKGEKYIILHGMKSDQKICASCGNSTFNWRRIYEESEKIGKVNSLSRCKECGNERYIIIPHYNGPRSLFQVCADCGNKTWHSQPLYKNFSIKRDLLDSTNDEVQCKTICSNCGNEIYLLEPQQKGEEARCANCNNNSFILKMKKRDKTIKPQVNFFRFLEDDWEE